MVLDLVSKTSTGEILNIVLRKQTDSSIEESEIKKKNCDVLLEQIVDSLEATTISDKVIADPIQKEFCDSR